MIALDTNAVVRLVVEDDIDQAKKVREIVRSAENMGLKILLLTEVLMETVWVLESVYRCDRVEIAEALKNILNSPTFFLPDFSVILTAARHYQIRGDFADLVIIAQSRNHRADKPITFDKKTPKAISRLCG